MGVKILILGLMSGYLYFTLQQKEQGLQQVLVLLRQNLSANHFLELSLVVLLTPLNWTCEALKWQTLAQKIETVSFKKALGGVLTGLTLGFFLPNNVGDAAGRIWSLGQSGRNAGVGAALLSNGLQFYVSLLFGTLAWTVLIAQQSDLQTVFNQILLALLTATLLFGVWLLLKRQAAEQYLARFCWFRWLEPYVRVIATYTPRELQRAFGWAALRYAVFSLQFWLLLQIFGVSLPVSSALTGIFLVFFAKTLIPAINFLGDLGIREASSLYFFSFFTTEPAPIVATTLTLWFVNILVPVLVGMAWLLRRSRSE